MNNQTKDNELKELQDKQFCTDFELKTLSSLLILGEQERWVYGFSDKYTEQEHLLRYKLVKGFALGKKILDIACGSGYGSYILANEGGAKSVLGVDIDADSVKYASIKNKHGAIEFKAQSVEDFESKDRFDVVVSFETIEHLKKPEKFLSDINKHLNKDGVLFLSTPISTEKINYDSANPYHVQEWGFLEFQKFVSGFFNITDIYIQKRPSQKTKLKRFLNILSQPNKNNLMFLIEKILTKISLGKINIRQRHHFKQDIRESSEPFIWDGEIKKLNKYNKDGVTYQMLICRKINE